MKRTVKDPDVRRSELVSTAQQLFFAKGYENTSVSDIVNTVGVAQGTFYYYFDSKQAVLESVVGELVEQTMAVVQPVITNQNLDAISKWNQIIQLIGNWKIKQKGDLLAMAQIMRMAENLPLQQKLRTEMSRLVASEFVPVVVQGIEEGVFETDYPQEATEHAFAVMSLASDAVLDILFTQEQFENPARDAWEKICAAQTAIERLLGAPCGSLYLADHETLTAWFKK